MIGWRHDFHLHPELGFEEHRTAAKVATSELIAIHCRWRKSVTYLFHEEIKEKCKGTLE